GRAGHAPSRRGARRSPHRTPVARRTNACDTGSRRGWAAWAGMVSSRELGADVLLIRRRRPIGEPAALVPLDDTGAATLDGTAGAGRIAQAMLELGYELDAVTQAVVPADIALDRLAALDLG